jgi:hypothetical protein
VEIFQHHGNRVGIPHTGVLCPGRCLPLQFWKRLTALSYVGFVIMYQRVLILVT